MLTTASRPSFADTRYDNIIELIKSDPGLNDPENGNIEPGDIKEAIKSMEGMHQIILDAIDYARKNGGFDGHPSHFISEDEVVLMNEYIRSDEDLLQTWTDLHGDDERGTEWGFHLIQNDGATTKMFGQNLVNAVLDGMYHLGFEIEDGRFLNEDGNKNAKVADVASWLNYFFTDISLTDSPLDQITETILNDPGLLRRVCAEDINEGAGSANAMNQVILEAANDSEIDAMSDGRFTVGDLRAMNAYIQENHQRMWVIHHGDDENGAEWGFHCVQNDGATTEIFGRNYVNTVADGIYHMGFDINDDGYFLNEDGNRNASVDAVAAWLNAFMFDTLLIHGTNASETLTGTGEGEQILGEGGNDIITAGAGDDIIVGGNGNDILYGEGGNDLFIIGSTGPGWDTFNGGAGNDTVDAIDGAYIGLSTTFRADNSIETFVGNGSTVILGSYKHNLWDFSASTLTGIRAINSGGGNDNVIGTSGDDRIDGGTGNDTLTGGKGNDRFLVTGESQGWDDFFGGRGADQVDGSAAPVIGLGTTFGADNSIASFVGNGSTVILGSYKHNLWDFSASTLTGIHAINSGGGNDNVIGTSGDDRIDGGTGNDILTGGKGNDSFLVTGENQGWDDFFGGRGADQVDGSTASVIGLGTAFGADNSIASFVGNGSTIILGSYKHNLWDFSASTLTGIHAINSGGGNDSVIGTSGDDRIDGGTGNDSLAGHLGDDILKGGSGRDKFVFADNGGDDRILDFEDGRDLVDLTGVLGVESFEDLQITEVNGNSVIDFNNEDSLTLVGIGVDQLSDADFLFAV